MQEQNQHINDISFSSEKQQYLREEIALRDALLSRKIKQPDVAAELKRISQRQTKKSNLRLVVISSITTAAIILGCVWGFRNQLFPLFGLQQDEARVVFLANNKSTDITLTNNHGKHVVIDNTTPSSMLTAFGAKKGKEGELKYNQAQQQEAITYQTITIPRKKEFQLTLADGTVVWLNSESQLSYPSRFGKGERIVRLRGEGYFKVTHDAAHPFVVQTENINTRVLGTEFNIRNYYSTDSHVTLINGRVEVSNTQSGKRVMLSPGQDAFLNPNGNFSVARIDIDQYVEWKDGYFYFDNKPLVDIMRDLGRWYNVSVIFMRPSLKNIHMHYLAKRNKSIEEAIFLLNSLNKVNVTLKNGVVTID
jgi:transmembrane sensor